MNPWESFETAVEACSIFFAIFGAGFVVLCAGFDDREHSPLKPIRPFVRVIRSSLLFSVLFIVLGVLYILLFPGDFDAEGSAPTTVGLMGGYFTVIALWPLVAGGWLADSLGLQSPLLVFVLYLLSCLFWALVIEAILYLWARRKGKGKKAPS